MAVARSIQLKESIFRHTIPELSDNPEWHEFIEALLNSASITYLLDLIHELPEYCVDDSTPFDPILRYVPAFTSSQVPLPFKGGSRYNILMSHSVQDLHFPDQPVLEIKSVIKNGDYSYVPEGDLHRIVTHYNLDVFDIDVISGGASTVTLQSYPSTSKIQVIKVVRDYTGMSLPDAKAFVEDLPKTLPVSFATVEEAQACVNEFTALGATATITTDPGTSLEVVSHVDDAIFVKGDPLNNDLLLVIRIPIKPDAVTVQVVDNPLTIKAMKESIPATRPITDDPIPEPIPPGPDPPVPPTPGQDYYVEVEHLASSETEGAEKLLTIKVITEEAGWSLPEAKGWYESHLGDVGLPYRFPDPYTQSKANSFRDRLNEIGNVATSGEWVDP